ncbi:ATP-grasp domain-containing protein [Methylibium sp.]|jgi:predicted ATP-grasp superfamily ATP-dependent carboligase|uniref:ATP-grasp domain-containing protein n=1 Tax=Methylibium sp. TaxID=2067992 RepID=UPI003D09B154
MTQTLFVYEYLSGGGLDAAPGSVDAAGRGELLAAGLAMRAALLGELAGPGVRCACGDGVEPLPGAPGGTLRPRPGDTPLAFVRRESLSHDRVWVIAPESDGLLLQLAEAVDPARWIGSDRAAIRLCSGKRATLAHLAARGLATPLAFDAGARQWVVKPGDGAGTLDTRRHAQRAAAQADLQQRRARGASATLEPWVDGEPLSLSLLCRDGAAELLSINRQRIAIADDGRLRDDGVAINELALDDARAPALARIAQAVARAIPGLRGFAGIDLVWHPQRGPVVIEVNPRLTCAFVGLSAALGRPLAAEILALHEEPVDA